MPGVGNKAPKSDGNGVGASGFEISAAASGVDGQKGNKRQPRRRQFRDKGDTFAALGERYVYEKTVRDNDNLSNAQKAGKARDWAHNFEVKGWDWLALEARKHAEEYQRAANEEERRKRLNRSRETEQR